MGVVDRDLRVEAEVRYNYERAIAIQLSSQRLHRRYIATFSCADYAKRYEP